MEWGGKVDYIPQNRLSRFRHRVCRFDETKLKTEKRGCTRRQKCKEIPGGE